MRDPLHGFTATQRLRWAVISFRVRLRIRDRIRDRIGGGTYFVRKDAMHLHGGSISDVATRQVGI